MGTTMILFTLGEITQNPSQTYPYGEDFLHEVEFRRGFE